VQNSTTVRKRKQELSVYWREETQRLLIELETGQAAPTPWQPRPMQLGTHSGREHRQGAA